MQVAGEVSGETGGLVDEAFPVGGSGEENLVEGGDLVKSEV